MQTNYYHKIYFLTGYFCLGCTILLHYDEYLIQSLCHEDIAVDLSTEAFILSRRFTIRTFR